MSIATQNETQTTIPTDWDCYTAKANRRVTKIITMMVAMIEAGIDPSKACEAMWRQYSTACKDYSGQGMSDWEVRFLVRDFARQFIADTFEEISYSKAEDIVGY